MYESRGTPCSAAPRICLAALVVGGGVDQVDAEVEGVANRPLGLGLGDATALAEHARAAGAQADGGDLKAGRPKRRY